MKKTSKHDNARRKHLEASHGGSKLTEKPTESFSQTTLNFKIPVKHMGDWSKMFLIPSLKRGKSPTHYALPGSKYTFCGRKIKKKKGSEWHTCDQCGKVQMLQSLAMAVLKGYAENEERKKVEFKREHP